MEDDVIRATYPQLGGWATLQQGRTIIDLREGEVRNPDGTTDFLSRDIPDFARSLAIRSRGDLKMALDLEANGLFDIPSGLWQHIDDEHFHRVVLIAGSASYFKLHVSSGKKAFYLREQTAGGLLHGPPEVMAVTIPPGLAALTTILDLTGKNPVQAFSFQILSGPLGVYVGYDKDATATDPRIGVLQPINRSDVEILNKLTVLPVGAHALPIVIVGEAWRF